MTPNILWIDDDPLILSAAKRLLDIKGFNIITCENPELALGLIQKHNIQIVVSDQRMPQMTGVELLKQIKEKFPLVTKIIVTGFSDSDLFDSAINLAGVFRFITKPWSEVDLLNDLNAAYEHYQKINENLRLRKEMKKQNELFSELSTNLENIVYQRTQEIQKTKNELELKNNSIRDLVSFTQEAHEMNFVEDMVSFLYKEMTKKFGVLNSFIYFEDALKIQRIAFTQKKDVVVSKIEAMPKVSSEIRFNVEEDKKFLLDNLKRPVGKIISVPIVRVKKNNFSPILLFIEHEQSEDSVKGILEYLTQRYQIISMTLERILSQQRLQLDSQRWAQTYDSLKDALCIVDEDGIMVRANEKFEQSIQHIYADELAKLKSEGQLNLKRGSQIFEAYSYLIPIEYKKTNFIIYFRDVTDEKKIYEAMIQNEKMAALGLLAGNIAHELNNPLTGIRSLSQILLKEVRKESYSSDLQEIEKASQRCQMVIRELLDFTKNESLDIKDKISVYSLVTKTLPFLKTALRNHNLELHIDPKRDFFIYSNFQILQQIIFNVLINACQAMPEKGTVTVSVEAKKNKVYIKIKDTGPGISDDIKNNIFDPFFTTKKEGEGTGIGLSFSKKMIEQLGGEISFTTQPNVGTEFTIGVPSA